jgi:hypothetical protein
MTYPIPVSCGYYITVHLSFFVDFFNDEKTEKTSILQF